MFQLRVCGSIASITDEIRLLITTGGRAGVGDPRVLRGSFRFLFHQLVHNVLQQRGYRQSKAVNREASFQRILAKSRTWLFLECLEKSQMATFERGLHMGPNNLCYVTRHFLYFPMSPCHFYKTLTSLSTVFIKGHVRLLQILKCSCRTSFLTHVRALESIVNIPTSKSSMCIATSRKLKSRLKQLLPVWLGPV